jgi:hypothetical protein
MSRQVRLPTLEKGDLQVLLVYTVGDEWEPDWEPLRGTTFGDQFSVVPKEAVDHAFHRLSKPLTQALGIQPQGALRKIPPKSRVCFRRNKCPLFNPKQCFPEAKIMPWCFEPDGVEPESVRLLATQVIELWRHGIYIVIVKNGA